MYINFINMLSLANKYIKDHLFEMKRKIIMKT